MRKIDTSSPASSIALRSLSHMCFVSSALPHWSSQLHSGRFTGGHLVMHCQRCCSPFPLPVRCVWGTTHTHPHFTQPDPGLTCMKHTHTVTQKITWGQTTEEPRQKDWCRQVGLTWLYYFWELRSIKGEKWAVRWKSGRNTRQHLTVCERSWEVTKHIHLGNVPL